MPITKGAKKALRAAARKKVYNDKRRKNMKEAAKEVKALVVAKNPTEAKAMLAKAYKAIDKAAKNGVIKKNTASRKKSRLSKAIKKAEGK